MQCIQFVTVGWRKIVRLPETITRLRHSCVRRNPVGKGNGDVPMIDGENNPHKGYAQNPLYGDV